MDLTLSEKAQRLRDELLDFMETHVYPNEETYRQQIEASGDRHHHPALMEELKAEARRRADRSKAADVIARAAHRLEALAAAPPDDGEDA